MFIILEGNSLIKYDEVYYVVFFFFFNQRPFIRMTKNKAIPFSRGSSQPRGRTCVSCNGRQILSQSVIGEVLQCFFES